MTPPSKTTSLVVYQETDGVLKLENLESPLKKKKAIYKDVGGVQKNQERQWRMLRLIPDLPHLGLKEREKRVLRKSASIPSSGEGH